jgi:eukaryotic-like serine/threonine-protein kinase
MSAGRLLGGRYQVGELLGYGGMAEVHHGRDLRLGRDVAIKMLRADLARDATFQMRFGREAQNAAALNHPAIVAVYDTGEERGSNGESLPFIVMEFVNGRTLKEILNAEGPLMPRRALEISADICAALEFSHRHGIIHRDIKPGNVMLTQTGQVKVMDFGIARALASGASTMTQTSAVIGTAQYLSPEQARGEAVDARSDVYATGCVVFELLTGHPPFVGDNPVSVAYQHVREDPKPPSEFNRDVTPDIDAVVLKALAKNPLNRYQSAAEMRADLLRAAAGRPVLATPLLPAEPTAMMPPPPQMGPNGSRTRVGNPQRRRASTWVMVALSILGLIAVAALVTGLYLTNNRSTTKVPNLVGLTVDQANAELKKSNLTGLTKNVYDLTCTKGQVVDTVPPAGTEIDQKRPITVNVCDGKPQVTIPPVKGLSQSDAESALKGANLTVKIKMVDGTADKGTVVDSDPAAGQQVAAGTEVELMVSKGNQATLPTVTNMSRSSAESALKQAGFKSFKIVYMFVNDPGDVGQVVNQSPGGNTVQLTSTTVTLTVGKLAQQQPPPSSAPPSNAPPSSPPSSPGS